MRPSTHTRTTSFTNALPSQTGLAGSVGDGIRRIVRIARPVESLPCRRNVGVREALVRIVVHATGHLLSRLCRREVRGARALVIVPRFVTELEIGDVLLGQDLIEQRLTSDCFGSQSVVVALFV